MIFAASEDTINLSVSGSIAVLDSSAGIQEPQPVFFIFKIGTAIFKDIVPSHLLEVFVNELRARNMGYLVPVEIDLYHPSSDGRPTTGIRHRGEESIRLGAIDPTFPSTTLPHDLWEEFRQSLERFGSIEENGDYFDIHNDTADFSLVFASLPSFAFSVQLIDGSSKFVLPLSHTDYLVPRAICSRFRLLINKKFSGDYPRLSNNRLNKFVIVFDGQNRRISCGTPKKEGTASGPTF
jgi:hypothetical protein